MSILRVRSFAVMLAFACCVQTNRANPENPSKSILFEVVRSSWGVERDETLVYLRVYSDGLAEAHPMRKVDFRNLTLEQRQLPENELDALRTVLADPATARLQPEYVSYWGNKDFGFRYDVTILSSSKKQVIDLVNFQPFLARKEGKPYPKQIEKLGCLMWKLRAEVSGESLEKDWLRGCTELGY